MRSNTNRLDYSTFVIRISAVSLVWTTLTFPTQSWATLPPGSMVLCETTVLETPLQNLNCKTFILEKKTGTQTLITSVIEDPFVWQPPPLVKWTIDAAKLNEIYTRCGTDPCELARYTCEIIPLAIPLFQPEPWKISEGTPILSCKKKF